MKASFLTLLILTGGVVGTSATTAQAGWFGRSCSRTRALCPAAVHCAPPGRSGCSPVETEMVPMTVEETVTVIGPDGQPQERTVTKTVMVPLTGFFSSDTVSSTDLRQAIQGVSISLGSSLKTTEENLTTRIQEVDRKASEAISKANEAIRRASMPSPDTAAPPTN